MFFLKAAICLFFGVSLSFSLASFTPPSYTHTHTLSLSVLFLFSLSLSLLSLSPSLSIFSSVLDFPRFLSLFFHSCFICFVFLLFLLRKTSSKYYIGKVFSSILFCFLVSCLVLFFQSFFSFYVCFCLKLRFLQQPSFYLLKLTIYDSPNLGELGVATSRF